MKEFLTLRRSMKSELKEYLLRQGRAHHICDDGFLALRECEDKDAMIDVYLDAPVWCMENNYPPLPVIRKEFSGYEDRGIFVDKEFHGELLDEQDIYALHHCSGTFYVDFNPEKKALPSIYLANDCDVTIKRRDSKIGPIRILVYSVGSNIVVCKSTESVEFKLYNIEL